MYQSVNVPRLLYHQEHWVITKKNQIMDTSSQHECPLDCRVAGSLLKARVRSWVTPEEFGEEALLVRRLGPLGRLLDPSLERSSQQEETQSETQDTLEGRGTFTLQQQSHLQPWLCASST